MKHSETQKELINLLIKRLKELENGEMSFPEMVEYEEIQKLIELYDQEDYRDETKEFSINKMIGKINETE